jgi:hypothetical protein
MAKELINQEAADKAAADKAAADKAAADKAAAEASKTKEPENDEERLAKIKDTSDKKIPMQLANGTQLSLSPKEIYEAAMWGLNKMLDEDKEPEKPNSKEKEEGDPEEPTAKISKLEATIEQMQQERIAERELNNLNQQLNTQINKWDITKESPRLAKKISILVAARMQNNPKLDLSTVFAEEVADFMEEEKSKKERAKEKETATKLVGANVSGLSKGGSGIPSIDADKPFNADDLKTNRSREAFRKYLESMS